MGGAYQSCYISAAWAVSRTASSTEQKTWWLLSCRGVSGADGEGDGGVFAIEMRGDCDAILVYLLSGACAMVSIQ